MVKSTVDRLLDHNDVLVGSHQEMGKLSNMFLLQFLPRSFEIISQCQNRGSYSEKLHSFYITYEMVRAKLIK